jgi:hypothetical protein
MYNFRHNCCSSFMLPRFQMPRSMAHKSSRLSLSEVTAGLSYSASRPNLLKVRLRVIKPSQHQKAPPGMSKIENKRISCLLDYKKYVHAPPL